ncbi:glutaredoxin [Candidatus Peregrinibacteria bacterium]|nr:glutaredoxin [Candidatus Peregrinibacteria bacterium]
MNKFKHHLEHQLKYICWLGLLSLLFFISIHASFAHNPEENNPNEIQEKAVPIHVFERKDCAHCIEERSFLEELKKNREDIIVTYHDINIEEEKESFEKILELEGLPKVTPTTIIGWTVIQGFDQAETTGVRFQTLIENNKNEETYHSLDEFLEKGGSKNREEVEDGTCSEKLGALCETKNEPFLVKIPFIGVVDVSRYSLPLLSIVLGFVDGFNPCAMWVLIMLLTILIQTHSKKRMWQMAGLFILAETLMYYGILNVWMTTWDFIGMDKVITPIVGLVSLGAGGFFLKEFFFGDSSCKVGNLDSKSKIKQKIEHYVTEPLTIITALGILGLAFSVNIIEFACSIGIPQAFTKILDINALSWITRQGLMFLYILFYMIDDFIVFGIALYSFEKIGFTAHKYTRASHLIGGIIMLILGLLFLFKPEALIFG